MSGVNRQFLLNGRPVGEVKESDLLYHEAPMPVIGSSEVLVRVEYLAVEPAMRGWMEDRASYLEPLKIGDLMRAYGVGSVIESLNPDYPTGLRVAGQFGMHGFASGKCPVPVEKGSRGNQGGRFQPTFPHPSVSDQDTAPADGHRPSLATPSVCLQIARVR